MISTSTIPLAYLLAGPLRGNPEASLRPANPPPNRAKPLPRLVPC